jgi:ABC-type sugar transport system ATPase subunit
VSNEGSDRSVRLVGVTKRFDDVMAVQPMDLDVGDGELVVLLGPSGCGKTTVLRMIAGLEEPTAGEIFIGGRCVTDLEPASRDIAMVFQNYALYPHMTVRTNLGFGLKMRKVGESEIARRVERATELLGLGGLLERRPAQLSGGQRQRVALGRAIVREPRVFLFDEPLSNLDARLRVEMRNELAALHSRLETTMIFVTHDQVEAMTLGQRIAVMNAGRLQQFAEPLDVYRKPANLFVARFIGTPSINTVEGKISHDGGKPTFGCDDFVIPIEPSTPAGSATLAIRPEAITLVDADTGGADLTSAIERLEPLGNEVLVHVIAPAGTRWVVRVEAERELVSDARVGIRLDRSRIHLFGEDGRRVT